MTATAEELQRELETLDARLADGERRIAEALNMEVDTTDWERFWWDMLRRYQETYHRLYPDEESPPYDTEQKVLTDLSEDPFTEEDMTPTG